MGRVKGRWGGGGRPVLRANPHFECYFTEVIPPPPITFDDFRDPPPSHVFIFQENLSGPPSESFQSFQ